MRKVRQRAEIEQIVHLSEFVLPFVQRWRALHELATEKNARFQKYRLVSFLAALRGERIKTQATPARQRNTKEAIKTKLANCKKGKNKNP